MRTIAWGTKELANQYDDLSSGHFFDRDTMRFFGSRITENYRRVSDTKAFFITTERAPGQGRKASIRRAELIKYIRESDGRECERIKIDTLGEFNSLTLSRAKSELAKLKGNE